MLTLQSRTPAQQARAHRAFNRHQTIKLDAARSGARCPDCGETENIQDNGAKGGDRAWLCEECHCQWDRFIGREG